MAKDTGFHVSRDWSWSDRIEIPTRGARLFLQGRRPPLSLVQLTSTFVWRRRTRTPPFPPSAKTPFSHHFSSLHPLNNALLSLTNLDRSDVKLPALSLSLLLPPLANIEWTCASEYWTPVLRDVSTCKLSVDVQSRKGAQRGDRQPWTLENVRLVAPTFCPLESLWKWALCLKLKKRDERKV